MMKTATNENQAGFTLIELMVSFAILAVIALMLTRIFTDVTSAISRAYAHQQMDLKARSTLDHYVAGVGQSLIRTNVPFRVKSGKNQSVSSWLEFITPIRTAASGGLAAYKQFYPARYELGFKNSQTNPRGLNIRLATLEFGRSAFSQASKDTDGDGTNEVTVSSIQRLYRANNFYGTTRANLLNKPDVTDLTGESQLVFLDYILHGYIDSGLDASLKFAADRNNGGYCAKDQLPDPEYMPHYLDLVIGLVGKKDHYLSMVRDKYGTDDTAVEKFVLNRSRFYNRRVYL